MQQAQVVPWQRTEEREPCDSFDALRQPYFGDLHVHTRNSADDYTTVPVSDRATRTFARGEEIALAEETRNPRAERASNGRSISPA